jgi:hypothetical protein
LNCFSFIDVCFEPPEGDVLPERSCVHSFQKKNGREIAKKMRSAQRIFVGVPRVSFRLFDGRPEAPALAAHYQVNEKEGFAMTWRQR